MLHWLLAGTLRVCAVFPSIVELAIIGSVPVGTVPKTIMRVPLTRHDDTNVAVVQDTYLRMAYKLKHSGLSLRAAWHCHFADFQ